METLVDRVEKLERPTTIHFAKVKPSAIIPTKRTEDAGYDLYACFMEDALVIMPHTVELVPTGIATAFSSDYEFKLSERGSTGTKGMAQRCGVIDSGFRNEIQAPISNVTAKPIVITKLVNKDGKLLSEEELPDMICFKDGSALNKIAFMKLCKDATIYPYTKAITQGVLHHLKESVSDEIDYDVLKNIPSERGMGMLGSSNK